MHTKLNLSTTLRVLLLHNFLNHTLSYAYTSMNVIPEMPRGRGLGRSRVELYS